MIRTPQWIGALLLAFFCVGCTTSDITNITPSRLQRNTTGLYKVEMIWESNAEALMPETIVGEVQVQGHDATYPMKRTELLKNRWETLVGPLAADENILRYRIKVNWKYKGVPEPRANSQLTRQFRLIIID